MAVFVSHSRRDTRLLSLAKSALKVFDIKPIALEDLAEAVSASRARTKITNLIRNSKAVVLLLTENVWSRPHTAAWVTYEVSLAEQFHKPLVVFQWSGVQPGMPILYWTDLVVFLEDPSSHAVQIQRAAKAAMWSSHPIARMAAGAAVGTIAGPVGTVIGGLGGLLIQPKDPRKAIPILHCGKCGNKFRLWNGPGTEFFCPHCLHKIRFIES